MISIFQHLVRKILLCGFCYALMLILNRNLSALHTLGYTRGTESLMKKLDVGLETTMTRSKIQH